MNSKYWEKFDSHSLLQLPIGELELPNTVAGSWLEPLVAELHRELEAKGLKFRPHVWVSDEWFSPDGVPGIAVPFYLLHPKLLRLERKMMGEAEGSTRREAMKLLRHEAGHAIDNAYGLRRNRRRQKVFGLSSQGYPQSYLPMPDSTQHVQHLPDHYAQAHPEEDWAETFAVWLDPRSNWQTRYRGWPAYVKVELVDDMMMSIQGLRPKLQKRMFVDPVSKDKRTLAEFYQQRRETFGLGEYAFFTPKFVAGKQEHSAKKIPMQSLQKFLRLKRQPLLQKLKQDPNLTDYQRQRIFEVLEKESRVSNCLIPASAIEAEQKVLKVIRTHQKSFLSSHHYRFSM